MTQFQRNIFLRRNKNYILIYNYGFIFLSITKFTNVTAAPNIKPDDRKLQKNPVVENDDKETDLNSKKEDEDELEAEAK